MKGARMITAAVSGSFHRHMVGVDAAVRELESRGVHVLSPADPRIVDSIGAFLFVASDRVRSIRLVQDRHLESIRAAHFLWLVCPDGYVGQSASMELGFAAASRVPVYATTLPNDLTLRQYVTQLSSIDEAVRRAAATGGEKPRQGFLIDPKASVEFAHKVLDELSRTLSQPAALVTDTVADDIRKEQRRLAELLSPDGMQ